MCKEWKAYAIDTSSEEPGRWISAAPRAELKEKGWAARKEKQKKLILLCPKHIWSWQFVSWNPLRCWEIKIKHKNQCSRAFKMHFCTMAAFWNVKRNNQILTGTMCYIHAMSCRIVPYQLYRDESKSTCNLLFRKAIVVKMIKCS